MTLSLPAFAKVNLDLRILGRPEFRAAAGSLRDFTHERGRLVLGHADDENDFVGVVGGEELDPQAVERPPRRLLVGVVEP